jgi:hypothetical protein
MMDLVVVSLPLYAAQWLPPITSVAACRSREFKGSAAGER